MIRIDTRHDGTHLRVILDAPKANILSIGMMREVRARLAAARDAPQLKLLTIEGAGDHFSYGASIEEHRAATIATALHELHGLVRDLLAFPPPTAAIVRGCCLGGGFELALACDLIFASNNALLGVPEITLGVFAPAASALLPPRIGASRAAVALLTGRTSVADEWAACGLVTLTAPSDELSRHVDNYFQANFASRSAVALRCATQASRLPLLQQVEAALPCLEHLYLDRLMRTRDASEGIEAFLQKREPQWVNA
jgi:cyclohexa-1,5-dienecarbonyl-CoA hydratase